MADEKEKVYCMDCKYALIEEYNEWVDVYCMIGGKSRETRGLLDTCEEGEERC